MADITKFRTSMGGFNRADVANYMESMATEHSRVKKQLQEENSALSARLAELEQQTAAQAAQLQQLQQKLTDTETALSSTESALEEALVMIEEQDALRAAQEAAAEQAEQDPDYAAMELEAYRRAEAMERIAQERSIRMRRKVSDFLDNLSARYEQTGQEVEALSEDIQTNLKRLQETLSDLDLIFEEASGHFDALDADEVSSEEE